MVNRVLIVITILLIGLLGGFLYLNLELNERIVNTGPTLEVSRKPYLAASQFLERHSVFSEEITTPPSTIDLGRDDVLIISNQRSVISMEMAEELYNWAKSGGHLIWSMDGDSGNYPSFLSDLTEVRSDDYDYKNQDDSGLGTELINKSTSEEELYKETDLGEETDIGAEAEPSNSKKGEIIFDDENHSFSEQLEKYNQEVEQGGTTEIIRKLNEELAKGQDDASENYTPSERVELSILKYEENVDLDSLAMLALEGTDEYIYFEQLFNPNLYHPLALSKEYKTPPVDQRLLRVASSVNGDELIQLAVGSGKMTVLSSLDIWLNDEIGRFDHAALLLELVGQPQRVIFQNNPQWPSVLQLLLDWAIELCFILVILLLAYLVRLGSRFGTIQQEKQDIRRSIVEHISAVAHFHWRSGHQSHLLEPFRKEILTKMKQFDSAFERLSSQDQNKLISERSAVSLSEVEKAFYNKASLSDYQFHQSIQILEKIRKGL